MANAFALATLARQATRSATLELRLAGKADDDAIDQFRAGIGAEWLADLKAEMPDLCQGGCAVQAWPDRHVRLFSMAPDATDRVVRAADYSLASSRKSNFGAAMQLDWDSKMAPVDGIVGGLATSGEAGGDVAFDEAKVGCCRKEGVCTCSEEGLMIRMQCNTFLQQFKLSVRRRTPGRAKLVDGMLLLQLHWEDLPDAGDAAPVALGADGGLGQGDIYWHVGFICLSPYSPASLELEWVADHADGHGFELRSTWRAMTLHRSIESLDRSLRWGLKFYQVADTLEPITSFDPSVVTAVELPGEARRTFWDPSMKKRKPHKKGAGKGTAAKGGAEEGPAADGEGDAPPLAIDAGDVPIDEEHSDDEAAEGSHEDGEDDREAEDERVAEEFVIDRFLEGFMDELAKEMDVGGEAGDPPPMPPPADASPPPAASSSGLVPAPAAEDEAAPTSIARLALQGGQIAFYPKDKRFTATCPNPAHGKCILTRSARPGATGQFGRPLGRIAHWVMHHDQGMQPEHVHAPEPTHADRDEARRMLMDTPGSAALLRAERKKKAEEPEEPIRVE